LKISEGDNKGLRVRFCVYSGLKKARISVEPWRGYRVPDGRPKTKKNSLA